MPNAVTVHPQAVIPAISTAAAGTICPTASRTGEKPVPSSD